MAEPNWTLEWLKIAQGLLGTLVGGGLVLLGGWLADRRKAATEDMNRDMREKALLTGIFAVRNHVAETLNDFAEDGSITFLEPLRTAQSYVHRMIDKAPGESESLMITVIGIGLALDTLMATIDRLNENPAAFDSEMIPQILTRQIDAVEASLDQFDIVSGQELTFMTDEEVAQYATRGEDIGSSEA